MIWQARVDMIKGAISKSRRHFAFSVVGLVVGASTLAFFLALSNGVQERVLNRLYPVNQVEFQAETVGLFGLGMEVPTKMDVATLTALEKLEGVTSVYPKQRAKFQARLWGGADVLGRDARVESFFDGIEPALIADELRQAEAAVLGPEILDLPCEQDSACGIGGKCSDGFCTRPTWWNIFADLGATAWCDNDDNCPVGMSCLAAAAFLAMNDVAMVKRARRAPAFQYAGMIQNATWARSAWSVKASANNCSVVWMTPTTNLPTISTASEEPLWRQAFELVNPVLRAPTVRQKTLLWFMVPVKHQFRP